MTTEADDDSTISSRHRNRWLALYDEHDNLVISSDTFVEVER